MHTVLISPRCQLRLGALVADSDLIRIRLSKISFENYGKLARDLQDPTVVGGRYPLQAAAQRHIVRDIAQKLELRPEDDLLEIGCNIGNLLVPLSFLVERVVGVDHPSCLEALQKRFHGENVRLLPGNFLEMKVDGLFDKVLSYSVLHYLSDRHEVLDFIAKALKLLAPGGRALFGDIPNCSHKKRFLESETGKAFERQWRELLHKEGNQNTFAEIQPDPALVQFDDELVLEICRRSRAEGFDTYILSQPAYLPFGHTREDIVVIRPE